MKISIQLIHMIILGMQKVEPCEWFLSFYANTFTRLFKMAVLDNLFYFYNIISNIYLSHVPQPLS